MLVKVFFAVEKNGDILMFFEKPIRGTETWNSNSNFCFVSPGDLPEDNKKEEILNLTWENEPLVCEIFLAIDDFVSRYEEENCSTER